MSGEFQGPSIQVLSESLSSDCDITVILYLGKLVYHCKLYYLQNHVCSSGSNVIIM